MSLADELSAIHSGARFYRADLHIHSHGASHDVRDVTMVPAKIVETAIAQGLSIIAVTDHNEIGNVPGVVAAGNGKPIFVLPGVELSTSHGHLLAYFRDVATLTAFYGRLDFVERGMPNSRCQTSMLECLNLIEPNDGFAVLAHIDGESGLERALPGCPPHKADILTHRSLLGIELKSPLSPVTYDISDADAGRAAIGVRRKELLRLGAGQCLARTLFSDSHSLQALGRNAAGAKKLTRLKMDSPSFDGIRLAFLDAEARVRLEDDVPTSVPRILGAKLEGGFLDDQSVQLSPNLNCIIGGRGAGKSTLFEGIRTLSRHPSDNSLINSDVWPDRLSLVWVDETGTRHTVVREKARAPVNPADPDLGVVSFPIECYGQGDTAHTSHQAQSNPAALLAYLDQFVEVEDLQREDSDLREKLLENQKEIEKAQFQVGQIPQYERALALAKQQIQVLEQAKAKEIVELERKIAEERSLRDELGTLIDSVVTELKDVASNDRLTEIRNLAEPDTLKVGAENYRRIQQLAEAIDAESRQVGGALLGKVSAFAKDAREQIAAWRAREREVSEEIEKKRRELAAQNIKLDLAYIRKVAEDEAKYRKVLGDLKKWNDHLGLLRKGRTEIIKRRREVLEAASTRRTAYGAKASKALQGALTDLAVSVKFVPHGFSAEAEEIIQHAMSWKTVQVPRAAMIVLQVTVPTLLDAIQRKDSKPLLEVRDLEGVPVFAKRDADEILARLGEQSFQFSLERCVVEDRPRISVTKTVAAAQSAKPVTRDFSKLSLGQQQSVLLALMLSSDGTSPLLIDQPEDNLDSEFIYHSLVPVLRRAKERRQIIVVTHNANIAVLGDAELVIALKGLSDRGQIMTRGSIDEASTKKMACQILEGTEEAFIRRSRIYGIPA